MLINKQKLKLLILALIQTNIVSAASVSTPITVASGTTTTINAGDSASHTASSPAATVNGGTLIVNGTITSSNDAAVSIDRGSTLTVTGTLETTGNHNVITSTNNGTGAAAINIIGPNAVVSRNSGLGGDWALDLTSSPTIINVQDGATIHGGINAHVPTMIYLGGHPAYTNLSAGAINGTIDMNNINSSTLEVYGDFTTGGDILNARLLRVRDGFNSGNSQTLQVQHSINAFRLYMDHDATISLNHSNADLITCAFCLEGNNHYMQNNSSSGTVTATGIRFVDTSKITIGNGQTLLSTNTQSPCGSNLLAGTMTLNGGAFGYINNGINADFQNTAIINLNGGTITAPTVTTNNSTRVNITANSSIVAATGYTANGVILKYTPSSATTLPLLTLNSGAAVDFSNATIKGDLSAISLNAGTYTLATNTNASGLSASSANATVDFPRRFNSTLSVSGGNLIVNLVKKNIVNIITHRQASEMLPRMSTLATTSSQMAEIENAVLDLSDEAREYAAKQLTPEVNGASTSSAVSAGQSVSRVALDRLAALRDTNTVTTGYVAGDINNDLAIWYKVFGGEIQQNKRKNVAGYDASLGGLSIGVDQAFTNSTTAGLGFSIANTHIKSRLFNAPNTTNIVSYQGIAYGSFDKNNLLVNGAINYANNRYVGNRIFKFGTIDRKALFKHHGHQFGIALESGYKLYSKGFNLKPIMNLSYIHSSKNPYTENVAESSDIGLKFDRSKTTKIDGGIGLKISKKFKTTNKSWTPNLHLRIVHDFKGARQASVSRFVGGGAAFATTGPRPARTALNIGCGIKILSGDNFELSANYELEGKEHYLSYNGSFSARYMF